MDTEVVSKGKKKGGGDSDSEDVGPSHHQVILDEKEKNPFK
jgi:hypothetical protein